MEITAKLEGTVMIISLVGNLDVATTSQVNEFLARQLQDGRTKLVADFSQLAYLSSAGLRVFATARKQLKERGGQASFIHLQPQIQEVFDIIKALPGIAIFKDVAEMDRYLAARQRSHLEK